MIEAGELFSHLLLVVGYYYGKRMRYLEWVYLFLSDGLHISAMMQTETP